MPELNAAQLDAVTAGDGPALVLAGAGSGKTRVIVERMVWLIDERDVEPRNILALTFTNRAAEEMRTRVRERLGLERLSSRMCTFHSFGLFVLRRDLDKLGRPKAFTIFDNLDQLALMKRLIKELPAKWVKVSPRDALGWISRLKQDLKSPDLDTECENDEEESFRALWGRYHSAIEAASAVDFDDLLVLPVKIFEEHPETLDRYRSFFSHILLDEYQDTNHAQYILARQLAGENGNLFAVGDEDQSIYSWRGADVHNILQFEQDFPGAQLFRLEQNYRSTSPILAAANAVVENNKSRLGKTLWTDQKGGEPVRFTLVANGDDEARFVADEIARLGVSPSAVAVLYRTNGQARPIEEAFMRKGIAYTVIGAIRFYARKEIKDLLCYMRLLANPADDESLRRIINAPPRGIGGTSQQRIAEYASNHKLTMLEALRQIEVDEGMNARVRSGAAAFVSLMDDLAAEGDGDKVADVLTRILEQTAYREYVQKSDEKDFRTRLEIVDEFAAACTWFDARNEGGLTEFLQDLALVSDVDAYQTDAPTAALLTCHSAKGLEFDHVFLIGLEEGYLPHGNALESDEAIEEERRLCYVAMTRARKTLTLSLADERVVFGERRARGASRFLGEIPRERLVNLNAGPDKASTAGESNRAGPVAGDVDNAKLSMGTRVRHAKFGVGRVMSTAGAGSRLKVRIRFDTGISRQFMVSAAPLEIVERKRR